MAATKKTGASAGTVKAHVFGGDVTPSNARRTDEDERVFGKYEALPPPFQPRILYKAFQESSHIRPNVDVYAANIEGYGYRLEPTIKIEPNKEPDDRTRAEVRRALLAEKIMSGDKTPTVLAAEVDARLLTLREEIEIEEIRLRSVLDHCAADLSFVDLRQRTREDLETIGNAYWEVLRNGLGEPAQFVYLSSPSIRLLKSDDKPSEVEQTQRSSPLSLTTQTARRRFRRFVQVLLGQFVAYFKEYGDKRIYSSRTGRMYETEEALKRKEPGVPAATEVVHFKIHAATSAYGIPRWVGAMLPVLGSRAVDEVNYAYFDNKGVPPLAILVSGGKLTEAAAKRIETYIRDKIKGRDNFHRILLVEAEGTQGAVGTLSGPSVRIELKPLREAQQDDALFLNYDDKNAGKVGAQFRLPKILRGDMADFNRATADAALSYAEEQVFTLERARFDHWFNRSVMGALGARFHEFRSLGRQEKDPSELVKNVVLCAEAGILTAAEARTLIADAFGVSLDVKDETWTREPIKLILARISAGLGEMGDGGGPLASKGFDVMKAARELVQLRAALEESESLRQRNLLEKEREAEGEEEGETIELQVPKKEFAKWVIADKVSS